MAKKIRTGLESVQRVQKIVLDDRVGALAQCRQDVEAAGYRLADAHQYNDYLCNLPPVSSGTEWALRSAQLASARTAIAHAIDQLDRSRAEEAAALEAWRAARQEQQATDNLAQRRLEVKSRQLARDEQRQTDEFATRRSTE